MKYFRATVSVLNIVVKICQNNSATSPVIYPQSRRIFVVRKKQNKNGHLDFFDVHIGVYIALEMFSVCLFTHPKSKKARLGSSPDLPEEMTALEKIKVQVRTSF